MRTWLRTHGTTAAAILIASVLTVLYGLVAVQSLVGAVDPDRINPVFERSALSLASERGGSAAAASGIVGLVIGAVVVVSAITIVGLTLRRGWAREAAVGIYGFLGVVATAVSIGGLRTAPSASIGLLSGVASIGIVALLLTPSTVRDFNSVGRSGVRRIG